MLHQKQQKLGFGLYIVNAVQEEVGLRGAKMMAHRLMPDLAIVTDVTHDTQSPLYNKIRQGDIGCGKGPVLETAPAVHPKLRSHLGQVAQKAQIAFQRAVSSGTTGTDADAFAYAQSGIPSALLSIPLKYMHTTVEMVDLRDVEGLIHWFYHFLTSLEVGHCFGFNTK